MNRKARVEAVCWVVLSIGLPAHPQNNKTLYTYSAATSAKTVPATIALIQSFLENELVVPLRYATVGPFFKSKLLRRRDARGHGYGEGTRKSQDSRGDKFEMHGHGGISRMTAGSAE